MQKQYGDKRDSIEFQQIRLCIPDENNDITA
ncbi:hypothetical protein V461_07780 [Pantoea ananatis BRT98]|nr:hypothetical protein V461_07780 [Pantoea ananatis BRT98]